MSNPLSVAILGAGNEGQAMAADLAMKGFSVNLYNRTAAEIEPIRSRGGIKAVGAVEGFGKLDVVSTDLGAVVAGAEIILVTTVANAHRHIAEMIARHLRSGQIVILSPGRTFGALEFATVLRKSGCRQKVGLAEAGTSLYISRAQGNAQVLVKSLKHELSVAVFPIRDVDWMAGRIEVLFPQCKFEPHILYTSLGNIGAVIHPAAFLLNWGRVEESQRPLDFYLEAISPAVAGILEKIDFERVALGKALGLEIPSLKAWLESSYGVNGNSLVETIRGIEGYRGLPTPLSLSHRYVQEDVPTGLVPLASLGKLLNIETPTMDLIIDLANAYTGQDFRRSGRTVDRLNLGDLSADALLHVVQHGRDGRTKFPVQTAAV
jgi:opine dehydrogenase